MAVAASHRRRSPHILTPASGRSSGGGGGRFDASRLRAPAGFAVFALVYALVLFLQPSLRPEHAQRLQRLSLDGSSSGGDTSAGTATTMPTSSSALHHAWALLTGIRRAQTSAEVATPAQEPHHHGTPLRVSYPLHWAGPVWSQSGYGTEAVSFLTGLVETGLMSPNDIYVTHSGDGVSNGIAAAMEPSAFAIISSLEYKQQELVLPRTDLARPAIVVCHSFPDCWLRTGEYNYPQLPGCPCPTGDMLKDGRTAYKIGRSMWEMDTLHEHLAAHAREMDELWVPSQFNVETFAASGIPRSKLFVVPQGVNLTVFDPARHTALDLEPFRRQMATGRESAGAGKPRFTFLSVFKWESRKGWEILLRAFIQEFKPDEAVDLLIITHPFMEDVPSWVDKIRSGIRERANIQGTPFEDMPRVYVRTEYVSDADYPRLYKACDALVVPTRGEGWGRPQMEAMAMEMPVISTNWSGPTAFMTPENSYQIRIDGLRPAVKDGPSFFWFFTGSSWAEPSTSHLQEVMRHVVTHRAEAAQKGVAARKHLLREFSPEAIAHKLYEQVLRVELLLTERAAATERAARNATLAHSVTSSRTGGTSALRGTGEHHKGRSKRHKSKQAVGGAGKQ